MQIGTHDTRQPSSASRRVDMSHRAMRAWARKQGIPVSAFGLIPDQVRKLYLEAMEGGS